MTVRFVTFVGPPSEPEIRRRTVNETSAVKGYWVHAAATWPPAVEAWIGDLSCQLRTRVDLGTSLSRNSRPMSCAGFSSGFDRSNGKLQVSVVLLL